MTLREKVADATNAVVGLLHRELQPHPEGMNTLLPNEQGTLVDVLRTDSGMSFLIRKDNGLLYELEMMATDWRRVKK